MNAIIYTWPPDYVMAAHAARAMIAGGITPTLAVDEKHPRLHVEGVRVIRTSFDRRGNLNGRDFILGHLRLLQEIAGGADYVMKADSDAMVFRIPALMRGRTETALGIWVKSMSGLQGCCYALKAADLPAMIELAERALPAAAHHLEDRTIGELAQQVSGMAAPVYGDVPTRYATYKPELAQPAEWWREHHDVVVFPRRTGFGRHEIAVAMRSLLP